MRLCETIVEDHILLVPPNDPHETLQGTNRSALMRSLPMIAPIFVAHFMTAVGEIYALDGLSNGKKRPEKFLLDLVNYWLGESDENEDSQEVDNVDDSYKMGRLFPTMSAALNSASILFTSAHQYSAQQVLLPLMGLARWAILYPISPYDENRSAYYHEEYARLHAGILECLNDVVERRSLVRIEVLSAKKLAILVCGIQIAVDNYKNQPYFNASAQQECLDRLGQFLHCLTAAKCIYGKLAEVVSNLKNLPKNRLIILYMQRYKSA